MRRWVCRICGGGKNAPERMRKLDVRRWCLGCSEETGTLVERVCPAAERQRTQRKERAAARRATKTKKRRAARDERDTVGGVHVPTLAEELRRAFVKLGYTKLRRKPTIDLRRSKRGYSYATGHAYPWKHRITMTASYHVDRAKICELVAHELAHLAVGGDRKDRYRWHGDRFNRALCDLAKAVWGVSVCIDEGGGGYGPSRALVRVLREKFATDSAHERSHSEGEDSHG